MTGFNVNFGGAKAPEMPEPGNYELEITKYQINDPKNSESEGKTIELQFKFSDQEISRQTVYHYLWVPFGEDANPWAAKCFFEAVSGGEIDNDFDWTDPDLFVGERVGCFLGHDTYEKGGITKKKLVVAGPEAFYEVD